MALDLEPHEAKHIAAVCRGTSVSRASSRLPIVIATALIVLGIFAVGAEARSTSLTQGVLYYSQGAHRSTLKHLDKHRYALVLHGVHRRTVVHSYLNRDPRKVSTNRLTRAWKRVGFLSEHPDATVVLRDETVKEHHIDLTLRKPRYHPRTRRVRYPVHVSRHVPGADHFGRTHLLIKRSTTVVGDDTYQTFFCTEAAQYFAVPPGVDEITIDAFGSQGGDAGPSQGGLGGEANATIAVTGGETLQVNVACGVDAPLAGDWNGGGDGFLNENGPGGGGGGPSDVRQGGTDLNSRVVVAGGGGGAGYVPAGDLGPSHCDGAPGGALIGGTADCYGGGYGGTQSSGGHNSYGSSLGTLGRGGDGAGNSGHEPLPIPGSGGGGGGGYFGGAGGDAAGGGGGSGYTPDGTGLTAGVESPYQNDGGLVTITYSTP